MARPLDFAPSILAMDEAAVLQRVTHEDGPELYDIVSSEQDLAHLSPWLDFARRLTPQKAQAICLTADERFHCGRGVDFWMVCDGAKDGQIGIELDRGTEDIWKVSYWVRAAATGRRLATRAATTVTEFAFDGLGASAVEFDINYQNRRSQAVARRAGAVVVPSMQNQNFGTWRITR